MAQGPDSPRSDKSEMIFDVVWYGNEANNPTLDDRETLMNSLMIDLYTTPTLRPEIVVLGRY